MITVKEIRDWYDRKYIRFGPDAFRPYQTYSVFLDYLKVKPNKKLLDIGCGSGYLVKAASLKGSSTFGVDISEEAVKIGQKVSPESSVCVGKGEELPFTDDIFDYVSCLGVLEHFLDMKKGLREMKRVAKEKAVFCIMVPNLNFLYFSIRKSWGTDQQDINEHLLSLSGWKKILDQEGLAINKIYSEKWYRKGERNRFSLPKPKKMVKAIGLALWEFLLPLRYCYQFIFICCKR